MLQCFFNSRFITSQRLLMARNRHGEFKDVPKTVDQFSTVKVNYELAYHSHIEVFIGQCS